MKAQVDTIKKQLIVTLDQKIMKEANGIPYNAECEDGNFKVLRFATEFICKATGARVNITSLQQSKPNKVTAECPALNEGNPCNTWQEISQDPQNPSVWNPDSVDQVVDK